VTCAPSHRARCILAERPRLCRSRHIGKIWNAAWRKIFFQEENCENIIARLPLAKSIFS
jgi:hypothetical protein